MINLRYINFKLEKSKLFHIFKVLFLKTGWWKFCFNLCQTQPTVVGNGKHTPWHCHYWCCSIKVKSSIKVKVLNQKGINQNVDCWVAKCGREIESNGQGSNITWKKFTHENLHNWIDTNRMSTHNGCDKDNWKPSKVIQVAIFFFI